MATPSLSDLEGERNALLESLSRSPLDSGSTALPTAADLWDQGPSPVAPESLIRLMQKSDRAQAALVQSEIDLIHDVIGSQSDTIRRSRFGWIDAAFPVTDQGQLVQCVWLRQLIDRPLTETESAQLAELTDASAEDVARATEKTILLSGQQQQALLDQAAFLRDTLQSLAGQSVRADAVSQQLMQSERTRSLGTLSSGIAHHFNNLLSVILGYSSYVLSSEDISDEASDALNKITAAAQKGRRLTEEILAFAGSEVETETACQLHAMLDSILSLLQSQHSSKVRIEKDFQADEDTVIAPASAVHQLVFTLLSNAYDSIPTGGDIQILTANEESETGDTMLRLTITDNGGVVQDRADGGHAVRLARAEGIAGSLSGSVYVSEDPGEVTRVEVTLPCGHEADRSTEEGFPPVMQLQASRIWVVDDDAIFRQMCRQTLESEGHQIEEMESGPEMQQRWNSESERPDLLIVDFSMPDYNGLELCQWLQEQHSTAPVILVSGFAANHPDIHAALQIKRTYFLQKPFSYRELLDTVVVSLGASLIASQ